jgi:hypothetical protein
LSWIAAFAKTKKSLNLMGSAVKAGFYSSNLTSHNGGTPEASTDFPDLEAFWFY